MNSNCGSTVSGVLIGNNWRSSQIVDITGKLVPGKNCLAIAATNTSAGPAGLVGKLVVEFDAGEPIVEKIDTSWKSGVQELPDWTSAKFDDSEVAAGRGSGEDGRGALGRHPCCRREGQVLRLPAVPHRFRGQRRDSPGDALRQRLGVYRFYINGQPVGNDYFTPDWTDYHKRVYYNTYDVTELVKANVANAIGGVLGAGWYAGPNLLGRPKPSTATGRGCSRSLRSNWPTARSRPSSPTARGRPPSGRILKANSWPARPTTHAKRFPAGRRPGLDATAAGSRVAVTEPIPAKLQAFPGVTVQETGRVVTR